MVGTSRLSSKVLLFAAAVGLGCGSAKPSPELVSARASYKEAHQSQAKELVPDELLSARQALDAAEAAFEDDENSNRSRALAYIAHRRALAAMATAGVAAANKREEEAEREYKEALEVSAKTSRDKLGKTESSLEKSKAEIASKEKELRDKQMTLQEREAELQKEKLARAEVEKSLSAAMKSLEEIAKVKEDARGTIITLSGAVLFKTNEAQLLPIAEQQLRKVAEALNAYDEGRKIVVVGHTDSHGSSSANNRLSLARAESVRFFIVNAGVTSDRIRAVGKGEDEPIADNKSAEGRANNRRVEIIVEGVNR